MSAFTRDDAQRVLDTLMTPWLDELGMRVEELTENGAVVRLPWDARISRDGGLVTGQALMSFADAAMVVVISSAIGGFQKMATIDMTTSFLAAAYNTDIIARGEVLRRGKRIVYGRIDLENADTGEQIALIQTTWTLLGSS
ncbi:MAG: PaaI family thioesterase [Proteobacteria bacterium]|nr:PaaI family thioesterase [Pseudomonadota bacterium]